YQTTFIIFFFSSRRRHTRSKRDWSSDVCSSDLDAALAAARRVADRPSLVIVRTRIAYGSPHKQDTPEAHGAPLGQEEVKLTKQRLGWPSLEPFYVPDEALAHWRLARERGARLEAEWSKQY